MKKILVAAAVMACFGTAGAAEDITVDVAVIGAVVQACPPPFRLTNSAPTSS